MWLRQNTIFEVEDNFIFMWQLNDKIIEKSIHLFICTSLSWSYFLFYLLFRTTCIIICYRKRWLWTMRADFHGVRGKLPIDITPQERTSYLPGYSVHCQVQDPSHDDDDIFMRQLHVKTAKPFGWTPRTPCAAAECNIILNSMAMIQAVYPSGKAAMNAMNSRTSLQLVVSFLRSSTLIVMWVYCYWNNIRWAYD